MGSFGQGNFPLCSAGLNGGDVRIANGFTNSFHQNAPYQENQSAWLNQELKSMEFAQQQQICLKQSVPHFTNGRKRSSDNISAEDMKKVRTEIGFGVGIQNPAMAMEVQMTPPSSSETMIPKVFQGAFYFPNSVIEHQSMLCAERTYNISLLENVLANYHGC